MDLVFLLYIYIYIYILAVYFKMFYLFLLYPQGCLCESQKEELGFLCEPRDNYVNLEVKSSHLFFVIQRYLCESQIEESRFLFEPRDICVTSMEKSSNFYISEIYSVVIV